MEVITKRPETMSYNDYVEARKLNNKKIKNYLRFGRVVYLAVEEIRREVNGMVFTHTQKYQPFVGDASKLKII